MATKNEIVIKKKIEEGHAGVHGGAWKVAYADFMTALMCFFLVMWLMGADEEIQQAIVDYFSKPSQSLILGGNDNPSSDALFPGNDKNIFQGQSGRFEEDQVVNPSRPQPIYLEEHKVLTDLVDNVFDGNAFSVDTQEDFVKFSVPQDILFSNGTSKLSSQGQASLKKLAQTFREYRGTITIEGHTDSAINENTPEAQLWSLSFDRAMTVRQYLINFGVEPTKLIPEAKAYQAPIVTKLSDKDSYKNRRVEFILRHKR